MSEKNKFLVVTVLLFSFLITPQAQSQATNGRRFSLQDAVRLAMKQNPDLKAARLEVEKSDARVREAWGNALPSVDISGTYTRTLKPPIFFASFNDQAVEIEMGFPHALNMALTGKQVLFNAAVIAGVGAAHVYSEMARDLYESKQLETVTKVRKAYYTALLAKEVINMMHSSLQNAEDNLKNILLMRKQGIVSEYDELRASVQVDNLRPEVIRSENNYALSLDALCSAIGMELDENFEVADSLALEAIDDSLVARAEEMAMGSNPNLSAMNRQIDLNSAITTAERSNYLPTIAAFGQYQYQAAKTDINFSASDLIPSTQVGITVSMNIFQGSQTRSRVEQAQLEQEKSVEQKVSLERTLRTGVHSVVGNIRQARKRVQAQERTVESAEQGYKIVTARFLANAATQLEVNDAQLALTQAKVNRVQAVYDYLTAAADLDQLIGRLPSCAVETNND
ncbi:MAG: TolC family protein [Bacteroidota bacterium]|jgi:outer membrane protein TolC